ncbi:MAG TPA: CPXCG motif-containing cysteine-rich protein [Lacunisphaera sp.]
MNDALVIECPHCGETFSLAFDVSEGSAEFIADCEICCRPMTVSVRVDEGIIEDWEVRAD